MADRSTGAERDLSSLQKILECAICYENFTVPKMLQCGHTFCEKCLQELYNASGQPGYLTCPTCRTTTSVPANDIAGLRTDFRANEMRDAIGILHNVTDRMRMCATNANDAKRSSLRPGAAARVIRNTANLVSKNITEPRFSVVTQSAEYFHRRIRL